MLNRLYRLLLLGLVTGACGYQGEVGELPARVTLSEKTGRQYYLLVPDDTKDQQLENLVSALGNQSPILKEKYGLEGELGRVFVFRERDRAGANLKTRDEMTLGTTPAAQRRRYFDAIAATYSRDSAGGEIGTLGHYSVKHKVVILRGPGAEESYKLLKKWSPD